MNTNLSIEQYIRNSIGDSHLPWNTLIPLTVIYSVFMVLGVIGNLATVIVILKNEYMKTATNIYLLNLALTDIATLTLG